MSRRGAILEHVDFDPMPLQSQLQASELGQRNYEFQQQMAAQKQRQQQLDKEKQKKDALDFIGGLGLEHIGDNTIDILTDKQMQGLQNKLMQMQENGADITDIKMEAQRQLPAIVNGHTVAQNKYNQIKAGLTELGKDYTTGDLNKARELAVIPMLKDVVKFDENGKPIGYNDVSTIPERNYVSDLLNDQNIGQWYKPSGGLESHVKSLPLTKIGESTKVRDKNGREIDNVWEGYGSVFSTLKKDPVTGATIGKEIKYETVPLGKNEDGSVNNVAILPKEEFDVLTGTPTAKADFTIKFNNAMADAGVDVSQLDPRAKDILQRKFAHDWLSSTGIEGSSFIKKQVDKQPITKNITNNRINLGGPPPPTIDIYKTIDEKASTPDHLKTYLQANLLDDTEQQYVLSKARDAAKDDTIGISDIYIKKFPEGIWVVRAEDKLPLVKLTPTGSNVTATNPLGQKAKQKAAQEAKKIPTNTEQKKSKTDPLGLF